MKLLLRSVCLVLAGSFLWFTPLDGQVPSGTVEGRVVDATTGQPVSGVRIDVQGTQVRTHTDGDGRFRLTSVPAGIQRVQASRIGYQFQEREITVIAGATATVDFSLVVRPLVVEEVVVTGYGTMRREAVTGSVGEIDGDLANVGVVLSPIDMFQGRVSGVNVTQSTGEPGAGVQVRIRGGTSISASNEPLYVIDGIPVQYVPTEPGGVGVGGSPSLPRDPLALLNPTDIASITILKDASAAAIYGSRGANGVILIETKKGAQGEMALEYDGYVSLATPASKLGVLTGEQYRQFVQQQVAAGVLDSARLGNLGDANTDWEDEVTRQAVTHNHNLSMAGGTRATRYRASVNYMKQQGVILSSGLERVQGRLNATHQALDDRLRFNLNVNASHLSHDYVPFENTGGFEGGVLVNMAFFDPTRPVRVADATTGREVFYELGTGRQSTRNPVALAEQTLDFANTSRILGNFRAELDLFAGLTGAVNVGVDRSESTRRIYFPRASAVGAEWEGRAVQRGRDNTGVTFQGLVTWRQRLSAAQNVEVVGGYEFAEYELGEFGTETRRFTTDAFTFNNLAGGRELLPPFSYREESRIVSVFGRLNYDLNDKYFLTAVLRRDGSSRFGRGNQWAVFPAISASWRLSEESFLAGGPFSELRLRAGWGRQGNEAVPPYASLIRLEAQGGARYGFGEQITIGVAPVTNPNDSLKWEETTQYNLAVDYGFAGNRFRGSVEYYVKDTDDLLLTVTVPQPALAPTRLENIGKIRNKGLEASLDALVLNRPQLHWVNGIVVSVERNTVLDLGEGREFITTGGVSGQGQSGQVSQRIIPGRPLGTFYGPVFVGWDGQGRQLFRCNRADPDCVNGQTLEQNADDFDVIGNANPDFTFGLRSELQWGNFDLRLFVRGEVGQEVFNNTALVYGHKSNVLQGRNFLASALENQDAVGQPAIYSSRWIEDGSFVRLQNLTLGYTFEAPRFLAGARTARLYVSSDNLLLLTPYSGYDPEVHTEAGLASRGIDYLSYPRPRTFTAGIRVGF